MKKRNKTLQGNETFVKKVQSDEVGIHVDGPNFNADEVNTNNSNDEEKRNTLNDFDSIDYENLIGEFLLELRENFKISTAVTCFVSETISGIITVDWKQHTEMFHRSFQKNFVILWTMNLELFCFLRVHPLVHVKNSAKKKHFQIISSRKNVSQSQLKLP